MPAEGPVPNGSRRGARARLTMELLETMRAESGRIELLDRHLARLSRAAGALGYSFDESRVRAAVDSAVDDNLAAARVRLTLDREGCVCVSVVDLDRVPAIRSAALVPWVPPADPRQVMFKTTDRIHYDAALAQAWAAGADEAILVDDAGRVVEATRANVWVRRQDEVMTPDVGERGLAGVMRAHLLATLPGARVAEVTVDDLRAADEVLLSNAVRGLFHVTLGTRSTGRA